MLDKTLTALKTLNSLFLELLVETADKHVYEYAYNLFIMVVLLKPKRILNLGTGGKGISLRAMLAALIYNGEGGHITTVDIKEYPAQTQQHLREEVERIGGERMVSFVTADDLAFEPAGKVDLVFLDTNPTFEHGLAELNKFSEWTDLIVCHDTRIVTDVPEAVQKAIDKFLETHLEWRNVEVGATPLGLGILYKTKPL